MGRSYKNYDEEYKKNIVKLVENGKAVADISREYGLNRSIIYAWIKKYGTIAISNGEIICNDDIEKLKKEMKLLQEENEILKKAMTIFTKR